MQRTFDLADQKRFAVFTGDHNPIHVDPVAARRTQAGAPVVHGMHILLWTLESALEQASVPLSVRSARAQFRNPLLIGQNAVLSFRDKAEGHFQITVSVDDTVCCTVDAWSGIDRVAAETVSQPEPLYRSVPSPIELGFDEMAQSRGRLALEAGDAGAWPRCTVQFGALAVRGIGALSTLVGMVSPGLHSLFGSAEVRFDGPGDEWIDFQVVESDSRFQRILYGVHGGGLSGRIEAFRRASPVEQPLMAELARSVEANEFAGMSALIVGGSRGLGAVTARLLAAGGARIVLTYAAGAHEAGLVRDDIRSAGGECEIAPFDVLDPMAKLPPGLEGINQLYYFATPKITAGTRRFNREKFDTFIRFYVEGLGRVAGELLSLKPARLGLFNASTVYVAERPANLMEYAMAKAASEIMAEELGRGARALRVSNARLPRLLTDQTASATADSAPAAAAEMLARLRAFCQLSRD